MSSVSVVMTVYPLIDIASHLTHFFKFWSPRLIFGVIKGRKFRLLVLIDTEEYKCMHDKLSLCLWSYEVLKCCEISDNI